MQIFNNPYSTTSDYHTWEIREGEESESEAVALAEKENSDSGDEQAKATEQESKNVEAEDKKAGSSMTDESAKLLKEVMKWKEKARTFETSQSQLKSQLEEANKAVNALKGIEETIGDVNIEDLKSLVESKKEAERKALEEKGEYDQIITQVKEANAKKIEELKAALSEKEEMIGRFDSRVKDLTVGRSFSDSKFIRERSVIPPRIALKEFGSYFDYEDGSLIAYDKPAGTEGRVPLVDVDGNKKTFDVAIEQLYSQHPDFEALIRSTKKPGAGSVSTESNKDQGKPTEQLRGRARISAGLEALNK